MKEWTDSKNEVMDAPWSDMCELQTTRILDREAEKARAKKMARDETGVKCGKRLEGKALGQLVEDIALENSGAANKPGESNMAKAKGKKSKRRKSRR